MKLSFEAKCCLHAVSRVHVCTVGRRRYRQVCTAQKEHQSEANRDMMAAQFSLTAIVIFHHDMMAIMACELIMA